ncbi:atpF2 [Symbiodinium natans]|uniref:AtpF2 protein n=1 Tax=Symbiodinium natans TaxID=878477 RepID=A0A812KNI7_9DINO|nr:atpF2 [Symbiodinium natans]
MARSRSSILASAALAAGLLAFLWSMDFGFVAPRGSIINQAPSQAVVAGSAALLAAAPMPAYAGGMFDFGLTLPFVAGSFLLLMAVLNALFYAPVSEEVEERNAKLLQTLSEATDMLAEADEMQVQYTAEIKEAREKAAKELADAREKTEAAIESQMKAAAEAREKKAADVRVKLSTEMESKISAAESDIVKRKDDFVKATLAGVGL